MKRLLVIMILFFVALHSPVSAVVIHTVTWSGFSVVGEDPNVEPEGKAEFDVTGSTLTITLTNTTSDQH